MSQNRRVLKALRRHPEGLTRVDFMLPNIIDGGLPILNFPARIKNLKDGGHEIVENGERYGCRVYKLVESKPAPVPAVKPSDLPTDEPPAVDVLFDPPKPTPQSPYFTEDAA